MSAERIRGVNEPLNLQHLYYSPELDRLIKDVN